MRIPALGAVLALLAVSAFGQEEPGPVQAGRTRTPQTEQAPGEVRARVREGFRLYRRHHSAVVSITATTRTYPLPPLHLSGVSQAPLRGGMAEEIDGTGFVVDRSGHVVTLARLVGNASRIQVRFTDGSSSDAEVVGRAPALGLAVLRAKVPETATPVGEPAPVIREEPTFAWFLSSADDPREPAMDPFEVSLGDDFGSAYDRYVAGFGDLAEGAAGGPLLDGRGRLLGMAVGTTWSYRADGKPKETTVLFVQGSDVQRVMKSVHATGRYERPMLGVLLRDRTAALDLIIPGGPAAKAGLREGDVLLSIDGYRLENAACIARSMLRREVGETLDIRVRRGEESFARKLELVAASEPPPSGIPPLEGATLELTAAPSVKRFEVVVTVRSVDEDGVLARAGLLVGDRLVSVDGRDPLKFLYRHRFRPTHGLPKALEVLREGANRTIRLQ